MPDMLKQTIVRLREAQRDLTPKQKDGVRIVEDALNKVETELSQARSALKKWKKGERFTLQKGNLVDSANTIKQLGRRIATMAEKYL